MNSTVDYPLSMNPAYEPSARILRLSVIGTASYNDDEGRYPVIIEYEMNETANTATIHEHKCPPADYDFLLEDIYWAVFNDLQNQGYYNVSIKDYTI
jgi:hypothetical protein